LLASRELAYEMAANPSTPMKSGDFPQLSEPNQAQTIVAKEVQ